MYQTSNFDFLLLNDGKVKSFLAMLSMMALRNLASVEAEVWVTCFTALAGEAGAGAAGGAGAGAGTALV